MRRCLLWFPYTWMSYMTDSREWYVWNNLEIRLTCFHTGVTDSEWIIDCRNALTLSQQFVLIVLIPIISTKRCMCMHISTPTCTPRYPLYELWSTGDHGNMPTPSMYLVPNFGYSIHAAKMIHRLYIYDPLLPDRMVPDLKAPYKISRFLLEAI